MDNKNHYYPSAHWLKDQRIFFHTNPAIKQGDAVYNDGIYWRRADANNVPIGYVAFIEAVNDRYGGIADNYYIGSIALGGMIPMRPKNQGIQSENLGTNAYDYETPIINNTRYFWDYSLNKVTTAPNPKTSYFIGLGYSGRSQNVKGEFTYEGIITVPYAVINSQGNTNIINQYNTVNNFGDDTALGWKYDRSKNELYFWNITTGVWELFNKEVYRFDSINQLPVSGKIDKLYINDEPNSNCSIPTRAWYWSTEGKMKPIGNPESVKLYNQKIKKTNTLSHYENFTEASYVGVYTSNNVQNLGDSEINVGVVYPITIPNQIISDCNGNSILITTTTIANTTALVTFLNTKMAGNWNNTLGQIKTTGNANVPPLGSVTIGTDSIQNPVVLKTTNVVPGVLTQTYSQIKTITVDVWNGSSYVSTVFGPSPLFKDDIQAVEWLNTLGIGAYFYESNKVVTYKNKNRPVSWTCVKDSIQNITVTENWTLNGSMAQYTDAVALYSGVINKCTQWETSSLTNRPIGIYIGNDTVVTEGYVGGLSLQANKTYYFQADGTLGLAKTSVIAGMTGCDCNLNLHIRFATNGSAEDITTAEMGEVIQSTTPCDSKLPIVVSDNDVRVNPIYAEIIYGDRQLYSSPFTEWSLRNSSSVVTFESPLTAQNSDCVMYDSSFIGGDKFLTAPTDGYYSIKATFEIRMTQSDWTVNGLTHATMDGKIKINGETSAFGKYQINIVRSSVDPNDITEFFAPGEISATVTASHNTYLNKGDTVDAVFAWDKKAYVNYVLLSYIGLPHNLI